MYASNETYDRYYGGTIGAMPESGSRCHGDCPAAPLMERAAPPQGGSWRFGAGREAGAAALKASSIEITISIQGKLVTQTRGTPAPDGVVFHIPLSRVALLDKPLDYSISYTDNN